MLVGMHSRGRLRLPGCAGACLPAKGPDPETPSCELAGGEGRRERAAYGPCHLMKGKLVWARPRAADVGGRPAKRVEGKAVMHMLLDTGGIRETMRKQASSLHTVTPRGCE